MPKPDGIPTRGTKKYTGCWTCRKRGIRCDEKRPCCQNCVVHGVICEGYKLKLCWNDDSESSSMRRLKKNRCLVLYEWKENQLLDQLQIDYFLDRIDTASVFLNPRSLEIENEFGYGPFTVFKASCEVEMSKEHVSQNYESIIGDSETFSLGTRSRIQERLEQNSFEGVFPDLEIEVSLLEFWDRHYSKSLTPVDETEVNPYNLLLKEAFDKPHPADIQRGIFHTVCAICSSFLSTSADLAFIAPEYQNTNFDEYRMFHKIRALNFVSDKYSWKEVGTIEELSFLVGSIYFLLATDSFNSSDEWQIHLRGAVSALKAISDMDGGILISGQGEPEGLSSALQFFCQMTKVAYLESTLYQFSDDVCNKNLTVEDLEFMKYPEDSITESLVYRNSGITPGMMRCLTNIVRFLQVTDSLEAQTSAVKNIEEELVECKPPAFNAGIGSLNPLIVHHQSMIFYTAINLLFLREVKKREPHDLQALVDSGIDHIEMYEEISKNITGLGLFWPCFIVCCEATSKESQARVRQWLEIIEPYGVDTMRRGSRVINTVWHRREDGDQVSWLSVIREIDSSLWLA
ncbi:unnamed protein product [Kuraishia capsulata CBS 1993]|uniref:Zn(2)-C6 fungal-type domain-containing protein n=1 Tax=Kuraishia capsulata CBS 1993 TaxID=1382522 RepID=W6MN22_9ASCO|nr:uncharacterized protein KUCA_T00003984001 [Kuraishia capsulata CBS 1993]CDK28004.1 unnamed protein product [Kuraishia capsulata CBS 1993]